MVRVEKGFGERGRVCRVGTVGDWLRWSERVVRMGERCKVKERQEEKRKKEIQEKDE